jgi:hypothetical protein
VFRLRGDGRYVDCFLSSNKANAQTPNQIQVLPLRSQGERLHEFFLPLAGLGKQERAGQSELLQLL